MTEFGNHVSFSDINVYHPEQTLELVRRRVNRKIAWLQRHFPQAKKDYEMLKTELLDLGVTPETTYLYIQGHTLFDNVISLCWILFVFCCVKNVSVKSVIWPSTTHSGKTNCRVTNIARIPWKTCFGRM